MYVFLQPTPILNPRSQPNTAKRHQIYLKPRTARNKMPQCAIRTYTLATPSDAESYFKVWDSHIASLDKHNITVYFYSQGVTDPRKVMAIVSYPDGASIEECTKQYMTSEEFKTNSLPGFGFKVIWRLRRRSLVRRRR